MLTQMLKFFFVEFSNTWKETGKESQLHLKGLFFNWVSEWNRPVAASLVAWRRYKMYG